MSLVQVENVSKDYLLGEQRVDALKNVTLSIEEGVFMAIAGPSGSGKSTLLNLIGCIDTPTSGRILIDGEDVSGRTPDQLADLRARTIGFIFQTFNLLPVLSAEENVEYPLLQLPELTQGRAARARRLLPEGGPADTLRAAPAEPAERRPAAAGGDRARARDQAEDRARRRADREPRSQDGRGHSRADEGDQPRLQDDLHLLDARQEGHGARPTGWCASRTVRSASSGSARTGSGGGGRTPAARSRGGERRRRPAARRLTRRGCLRSSRAVGFALLAVARSRRFFALLAPASAADSAVVAQAGKPGAADAPSSRDELFGLKPPAGAPADEKKLPFSVSGFYDFLGAYTYSEPSHWSRAVNRLQLSAQGEAGPSVKWKIGGRFDIDPVYYWSDFYLEPVKQNQRTSAFWRETYVDFSAGGLDFRVGAQNIVWGEVVGIFVADVVSARDQREFLLPSFDIIRKPQWAARAEYFKGDSHVELIWIPVPDLRRHRQAGRRFLPGAACLRRPRRPWPRRFRTR